MKYLLNQKIETVYFCLYLSLILGLFLNEDFAFGFITDYLLHKKFMHIFENDILNALLNYEKLDFGTVNGKIILADEISPDTCRLWDIKSDEKLDKDRFRKDLGNLIPAYEEVARRLNILHEQTNISEVKFGKPTAVKIKKK